MQLEMGYDRFKIYTHLKLDKTCIKWIDRNQGQYDWFAISIEEEYRDSIHVGHRSLTMI